MKHRTHVSLIALGVAVASLGLSWLAFVLDPWTGEGDGTVGIKWITVPLAFLGLPFLVGMTLSFMIVGNSMMHPAGFVGGAICQYCAALLLTWLVVHRNNGQGKRPPAESVNEEHENSLQ